MPRSYIRRSRGGRAVRPATRRRKTPKQETKKDVEVYTELDFNKDTIKYFTTDATFDQHYEAQNQNIDKYLAIIVTCETYSIELNKNSKSRALAAALARHDMNTVNFLLNNLKHKFGFVEVIKALTQLDSAREIRAKEKKLKRHELSGVKLKSHKLGKIKNDINNLNLLKPKVKCSVSGAMARQICKWVRQFTVEELEFFALRMPTENWMKLANLIHLHPEKDFPQAKWFLPFCFGYEPPEDTLVYKCMQIDENNINDHLKDFHIPFSILKELASSLNDESKLKICERESSLDTLLWYYEDLAFNGINEAICKRLDKGDKLTLGYGKLMERILMLKDLETEKKGEISNKEILDKLIQYGEIELKKFISKLESPIAVLGDASHSMNVAIRTATIIASLLTTICSAKLSFFSNINFYPNIKPDSIKTAIDVAYGTVAKGTTAPAASLLPYYENKEIVKTFIIVTDEEENDTAVDKNGTKWKFYDLFLKYQEDVYPARLIFISFLNNQHDVGEMYGKFIENKISNVSQYKFSTIKPDLTKLGTILGKICSNSGQSFDEDVLKIESLIKANGLIDTWNGLRLENNQDNMYHI